MTSREGPIEESRARELLGRERERIEDSLAEREQILAAEIDEIDASADAIDEGELIEEEEVDDALLAQLRAELEAVERAEKRLEEGAYGFSVDSGEPIPAERLEAVPWAERTAEEQVGYERSHGRAL
jgi:RNA polymerase-binding transcription factor